MAECRQRVQKGDVRQNTPQGEMRRNRSFASGDGQVAVFSSMSAAFSPIMIDGALVLPDVSVGMNRGVGDPQARNAMDAKLGVDDCHRV